MFRKSKTEYIPYEKTVTITENKAPTDESIKLYKELLENAFSNILESYTVNDNNFSGVRLAVNKHPMWMNNDLLLTFTLNGHRHTIKCNSTDYNLDYDTIHKQLVEKCAEEIANQIVNVALFDYIVQNKEGPPITLKF